MLTNGPVAEAFWEEKADRWLLFRSGVWRKATWRQWIPPHTVTFTVETVTSSSTPTAREAVRSTSSTPGENGERRLHVALGRHVHQPIKTVHVWFRQGLKCTQDELAASAYLTVKLDDSMGGCPVQVRA